MFEYDGNPTAIQAPSSAPAIGGILKMMLADSATPLDPTNLQQALKAVADFVTFLLNNGAGVGLFGDGSDGSASLDGVATVTWASLSGGVYAMSRDANMVNLTVGAGATIATNGFRIFCTGILTTSGGGKITANGVDGSASNLNIPGTGAPAGNVLGGANGGAGAVANGAVGSSQTNSKGGAGGNGGNGSGTTGGSGGTVTAAAATRGNSRMSFGQWMGHALGINAGASAPIAFTGGAGGGGAGGNNVGTTGGPGGGGGGVLMVSARIIVLANAANIIAAGGTSGLAGSSDGGGGGGGGGYVRIVCVTISVAAGSMSAATNCPGGAGAAGGSGATAGANGSNGTLELVTLS